MRWRGLALLGPLAWLAAGALLPGACSRDGSPDAPDTTVATRQRLVALEEARSFGAGALFAALHHRDPRVRRTAVVALGRIQDAAATDSILPLLDDADSTVVEQCAWALRQLQGLDEAARFRVEAALDIKLRSEPTRRLWMFVEALRPHAGPASFPEVSNWVAAGLFAGMGSEARPPRLEGMAALTLVSLQNERADKLMATLGVLTNRAPEAAWRIAEAMTLRPDSSYLRSLLSLVDHSDAEARAAGARALAKYEAAPVLPGLYRLLSDVSWEVRASALRSLGELGAPQARSYCAAMAVDRHPLVREAALAALERLGAGEHVDLVETARRDPVPAVRLAAVRVVAKARGRAAQAAFAAAREDSIDFVRSDVLDVAADVLGPAAAARLLVETLRGASVRERCQAAQALGNMAASMPAAARGSVQESLAAALQDEDFVVASLAAEALGKLAASRSAAALVQAYAHWQQGHHAVDVRLAVVPALEAVALATPRARDSVLPCLETAGADADARVAQAARQALAKLRGASEPAPPVPTARPGTEAALVLPSIDRGLVQVRLVTRHGATILELDGDAYPRTVGNFLALVDQGFYADGVFHRVVPAFVVQGGCPRGDGWGDAGTFLPCEYGNLRYDRAGIVGMAHAGKDTGGSQFFITHLPVPRLDGRYTAFGRVVEGMENVDDIVRGDRFRIERVAPLPPP